eukprot:3576307-Alexandrium_andersonii.AAC.1
MPLQEGMQFKPEYAGYARVQVAVNFGVAASLMPGRLPGNRGVLGSEGVTQGRALPCRRRWVNPQPRRGALAVPHQGTAP